MSDYAKHAKVWDWAGYDRTPEFEFWFKLAKSYGNTVLSIMSAIGETGAYMAERGLQVTALDYTKEMISEGEKRFAHLSNLSFVQADAREYNLKSKFDFAFIGSTDLHHMQNEQDVKKVLLTAKKHLKDNGGLGLELWYPSNNSWQSAKRKFLPLNNNTNPKVWKEGSTSYNAELKQIKISQEVFVKENNTTEQFTHEFKMQLYSRKDLFYILNDCGFKVVAEYGDYNLSNWSPESNKWLIMLI